MNEQKRDEELPDGVIPLRRDAPRGPGGCGFTGCMYVAMVFAAIAVILLVIGVFVRIWTAPPVLPRM